MKAVQQKIIFQLEDTPPLTCLFVMAAQHVLVAIVDMAMPVMVIRAMGGTIPQTILMVQMSLVAMAVGTVLQCQKKGLGTGYLLPQSVSSLYLAPSLLAAQCGGLALVAGMTTIAGVGQMLFAQIVRQIRGLFPTHIPGVVLVVNGWVVLLAGLPMLVGWADDSGVIHWQIPFVGVTTLMAAGGVLLKGGSRLRLYALAISLAYGYFSSHFLKVGGDDLFAASQSMPLFMLPAWQHTGFHFDLTLLGPFVCAAMAVGMKGSGLITKAHQVSGITTPPDCHRRLSNGLFVDGAGCLLSGLLGGCGTAASASNMAVSIVSGATSRRIGYGVAVFFLALAFFPKLTAVLSVMPAPVMGAVLVCIGINLMQIGTQLIRITPPQKHHLLTVGLPLGLGLWFAASPPLLSSGPLWLSTLMSDAISMATLTALALHHLCDGLRWAARWIRRQPLFDGMERRLSFGSTEPRLLTANTRCAMELESILSPDPNAPALQPAQSQVASIMAARRFRHLIYQRQKRRYEVKHTPNLLSNSKAETRCKQEITIIDS